MNHSMDELIKEKFAGSEYDIPASFDEKFDKTVEEIKNSKIENDSRHIFFWLANHKAAAVVILVLILSMSSVTSYAVVNMFQQRMNAMPESEIEKYNKDVQESHAEADAYSRKLTDSEEEKIFNLRKQYEKDGKFPDKDITQVERYEDVTEGELCFVTEESKFYLPERNLSEEEMLEIIDLQEKRDYSVQQQNSEKDILEDADNKAIDELQTTAIAAVKSLYNLDEKDCELVSSHKEDDCYEFEIKENNTSFFAYCSKDGTVERILCAKENLPAHESDVEIETAKIKSISKKIKKQVETFSGKEIESQSIYCLMDSNGKLAYGTISYYHQMSDGSGCVAVYSTAYNDLYDIYIMNDKKSMKEEIESKIKQSKKYGCIYKLVK
ncbi:MAG: hypothetical protein J1F02_11375 [Lachnospiraceae bacterium]|nr:hypothetical protein [Lachnospiraceae bacterium]